MVQEVIGVIAGIFLKEWIQFLVKKGGSLLISVKDFPGILIDQLPLIEECFNVNVNVSELN